MITPEMNSLRADKLERERLFEISPMKDEDMLGLRLRLDTATQLEKHKAVQIQKCMRIQKLLQWYENENNVSALISRVWKV